MRAKLAIWTTLAAAALAGAALAQEGGQGGYDFPEAGLLHLEGIAQGTHSQPVFAVVGAHLVSGRKHPAVAALTLVDHANPQFTCQVERNGALVRLACSDGSEAELSLYPYGCGHSLSGQAASLCYGFEARSAARRLMAPPGHTLSIKYGRLALKPTAG